MNRDKKQTQHRRTFYGSLISACAWLLFSAAGASANSFAIFSAAHSRSTDLSAFTKWTRVLEQSERDGISKLASWQSLRRNTPAPKTLESLRTINAQVNQYRYVEDHIGWGRPDYWATPKQFLERGGGDCEDYAIVKYMLLREAGWRTEDLRIVVLQDHRLNQLHSVLSVKLNGETYLLDNQIKRVVKARDIGHYAPIYSINERAWWRHAG